MEACGQSFIQKLPFFPDVILNALCIHMYTYLYVYLAYLSLVSGKAPTLISEVADMQRQLILLRLEKLFII